MYEARNLSVRYGAAPALWDASLTIGAGELVVIVGPNGAGKSTLINALAGINRVAGGQLLWEGKDITTLPAHRFCDQGLAIVPESRRLFGTMTVLENLEMGSYRRAAKARRAESLDWVCTIFPALRDRLQRPAAVLSGGQQQQVAIARALMARPRLLLLDEPSLGLSPVVTLDLFRTLAEINAGSMAVLLVEQNVAAALDLAQRAYVLEEGRIVAEGTPAELRGRREIERAYLGL